MPLFKHLSISAFLLCLFSFNQTAFSQDINTLPMFGGAKKTAKQIALDDEFRKAAIQAAGSPEQATESLISKGFEFIAQGDSQTAMKRFNQAWLLSPESAGVFWGFAVASSMLEHHQEAFKYFQRAINLDPQNVRLICDFGFAYIQYAMRRSKSKEEAFERLDQGIALFQKASVVEPKYGRTYFNWAVALFHKREFKDAWEKLKMAESLEPSAVDPRFVTDLENMMQRPK